MSAFEDFWMKVGDRIKIATPPAERTPVVRRALAARAFEKWRVGRLHVPGADVEQPTPQAFIDAKKKRDEGWPELRHDEQEARGGKDAAT